MAKFITGNDLKEAIYDVIWHAENELVIVSPFIKLNDYFKNLFEHHKHNWRLHILVVFGKNEAEPTRSLKQEDFEFFKQFKNISIVYCNNLHAKYYANEHEGVITSINLYDASFEHNIEFGVHQKTKVLNSIGITGSADVDAWNYVHNFTEKYPVVFIKRPVIEKGLFSSLTGKKYLESEELYDGTKEIIRGGSSWDRTPKKFILDFPEEIAAGDQNSSRISEEEFKAKNLAANKSSNNRNTYTMGSGYCIRSKRTIPFNPDQPYSDVAFKSWARYKNPSYKESYCHKCGENWLTSKEAPLCKSCA